MGSDEPPTNNDWVRCITLVRTICESMDRIHESLKDVRVAVMGGER